MQMQLPIFPEDTKLVNACLGFRQSEDYVYYLHNGSPIFCHEKNDMHNYRYITANLVVSGLCKCSELADALGVRRRNIERYAKSLREKGSDWFLKREQKRGQAHRVTGEMKEKAEKLINEYYSVSDVARMLGVTEGALRYHIKNGTIKKKVATAMAPGKRAPLPANAI